MRTEPPSLPGRSAGYRPALGRSRSIGAGRIFSTMVEIINPTAEVLLAFHAIGKQPPTLPEDLVRTLQKMGDILA